MYALKFANFLKSSLCKTFRKKRWCIFSFINFFETSMHPVFTMNIKSVLKLFCSWFFHIKNSQIKDFHKIWIAYKVLQYISMKFETAYKVLQYNTYVKHFIWLIKSPSISFLFIFELIVYISNVVYFWVFFCYIINHICNKYFNISLFKNIVYSFLFQ